MHFDAFMRVRRRDEWAIAEDSEQLEQLRTGDFSSLSDELKSVIEHDKPALRYFGLVARVCKELAALYVREPNRRFINLSDVQSEGLESLIRRNRVNRFMQTVSEKLVCHNSQIIAMDPAGPGKVELYCFSPYEFDVFYSDPLRSAGDIRTADRVEIRVPVGSDKQGQVMFGKRVYTSTEAWVEAPGGDRRGIFNDDLSHGYGYIPLVGMRREYSPHGYWAPPLPYDILSTAISVCIAMSDCLHIASRQCHGRSILIGNGARTAAKEMPNGVDYITAIESADVNDLEYKFIQGDPKLDKYIRVIERVVQTFATNRNIRADSLLIVGLSAIAGQMESHDQEVERRRVERIHEDGEQDFFELLLDTVKMAGNNPQFASFPVPDVRVDFLYVTKAQNTLQEAQAAEIRFRQGADSIEEFVARTEGIAIDEAKTLVNERLESVAKRMGLTPDGTPGLDRIDKNQPSPLVAISND